MNCEQLIYCNVPAFMQLVYYISYSETADIFYTVTEGQRVLSSNRVTNEYKVEGMCKQKIQGHVLINGCLVSLHMAHSSGTLMCSECFC